MKLRISSSAGFWHESFFVGGMSLKSALYQVLNSRQLLSFVTVARTKSFTIAGKELSLSQSAVSHGMTTLEEEVGCALLNRSGKNINLTPAGEHLLYYAEKILADMTAARQSLNQRQQWGKGQLRIGANVCLFENILPGILRELRKSFPECSVTVKPGDMRQCVEWLGQDQIDLAFVIAPGRTEAVEISPLFADEVRWILPAGHPWDSNTPATPEQIAAETFVCDSAESHSHRLLEKYFAADGVRLKVALEVGNLEAVRESVKQGLGITALAPWTVRKDLEEGTLVTAPLGRRKLKRNWCLLRSPNRKPGLSGEVFAKLALDAVSGLSLYSGLTTVIAQALCFVGLLDPGTIEIVTAWLNLDSFGVAV